jgi:hypothetical protein
MKKINTLIILLFAAILEAQAFSVPDTIIIRSDDGIERITADLDSLVNCWYVKMALQNDPDIFSNDTAGIQYDDSVYRNRISKINSIIKLQYNNIIRNHIQVYTINKEISSVQCLVLRIIIFR